MSREMTFAKKTNVVVSLQNLEGTSYYHKRQLVKDGYLEPVKAPELKKVVGSRGREPLVYNVTGKGKNLIRLSASWAKKPVTAETATA